MHFHYVWAANANDRLEKRELTLGEYDPDMMQYEILDGLTTEDYIAFPIAFPAEGCEEGQQVTRNIEQSGQMDMGDAAYDESLDMGGEVYDEGMDMGGEVYDEGMDMGGEVYDEGMDMGDESYDESMAEDFFEEEAGFDEELHVLEE